MTAQADKVATGNIFGFCVSMRRDTVCTLCVCLLLQDESNSAQLALSAQISLNKWTTLPLSLSLSVFSVLSVLVKE